MCILLDRQLSLVERGVPVDVGLPCFSRLLTCVYAALLWRLQYCSVAITGGLGCAPRLYLLREGPTE